MSQQGGNYRDEPVWHSSRVVRRATLPEAQRSWLLDPASLTRRLQRRCSAGGFRVEVVSERLARPMHCESHLFARPRHELALIRQVRLRCGGEAWVFARSVIPLATLTGSERRLAHLGNRPLGAYLFAEPSMRREPLEVARIAPHQRPYRLAMGGGGNGTEIWGRRSLFFLHDKPLLVSEFFLPDLFSGRVGL